MSFSFSTPLNAGTPAQVNENKVRVIALLVLFNVLLYLNIRVALLPTVLLIDFGLRAFDKGQFSPFARIADVLVRWFKLEFKPVFYPPKRFAARIGLAFSILMLGLQLSGLSAVVPAAVLAFFAALESLAGFCAGCYVYNLLVPLWQKWRSKL